MNKYIILLALTILSGCSKQGETSEYLDKSKIPWGRPTAWETSMPLNPGLKY